jgi:hypothetical protein
MNYAVAYLVGILFLSTIYWIIRGKNHYTGPPLEGYGHSVGFFEPRKSNDEETSSKRNENLRSTLT